MIYRISLCKKKKGIKVRKEWIVWSFVLDELIYLRFGSASYEKMEIYLYMRERGLEIDTIGLKNEKMMIRVGSLFRD